MIQNAHKCTYHTIRTHSPYPHYDDESHPGKRPLEGNKVGSDLD